MARQPQCQLVSCSHTSLLKLPHRPDEDVELWRCPKCRRIYEYDKALEPKPLTITQQEADLGISLTQEKLEE